MDPSYLSLPECFSGLPVWIPLSSFLLVSAQPGLWPDTCPFSPQCASPHAGLHFHWNLVGSACILQAGLSLQALALDMPSGLRDISDLLSSNSFLLPSSLSLPTEGKHLRVVDIQSIYLFVLEFWISNIYLNEMSNNLGITTMDLFCFYNICHKKSVFYCKWL